MIVYVKTRKPIIVKKSDLNPPTRKIRLVKRSKGERVGKDEREDIREFFEQWCIDNDRRKLISLRNNEISYI